MLLFYKLVFKEIIHQVNQNEPILTIRLAVLHGRCSWTNLRSAEKWGRHHLGQHLLRLPAAAETSLHELLFPPRGGRYQSVADSGIQVRKISKRNQAGLIYSTTSSSALCVLFLLCDILRLMNLLCAFKRHTFTWSWSCVSEGRSFSRPL